MKLSRTDARKLGLAVPRGSPRTGRDWESTLLGQIRAAGLPEPDRQVAAVPGRRFRWDFGWPEHRLLVEVQGAVWSRGKSGHTSGSGINRDTEKLALAVLAGWRVLQVTSDQIRDGRAIEWIARAMQ